MSFLSDILEVKHEEVKKMKQKYSFSFYRDSDFFEKEKISLSGSVKSAPGIAMISEIKKASPSKGILREDFNHMHIAEIYMRENISAVSILTDKTFFRGNINFLREIAAIKEVPLLRKDFIIDPHQVWEAKSNGADAILLISEILSEHQIKELSSAAFECGMEVLLELHSAAEINKIDFGMNSLIGINNRDLKTFEVDINITLKVAEDIPDDAIIVSESGYHNKTDVNKIKNTKVKAILAGEHFMRSADIKAGLTEFLDWCSYED